MRRLTSSGSRSTQIKSACPQKIGAILDSGNRPLGVALRALGITRLLSARVRALWLAPVQETVR